MLFKDTPITGVKVIEPETHNDQRGFFARLFCPHEFAAAGVDFIPQQMSMSHNIARYSLRGMHYCTVRESKIVRCMRGRMLDVLFDIRSGSPSFLKSYGIELDADHARSIYVPPGVAHGFITLEDNTDVLYNMDRIYNDKYDAGLRWNDPAINFKWPVNPLVINNRDNNYPDFIIKN